MIRVVVACRKPARSAASLVVLVAALCASAVPVAGHDTLSSGSISPDIAPGTLYTSYMLEPGTYAYHCHPHPEMTGTLVVSDTAPPGNAHVTIHDDGNLSHRAMWGFRDDASGNSTTTVRTGAIVAWVNAGNFTHDVSMYKVSGPDGTAAPAAPGDSGAFELWTLGLVLAAIALVLWSARRRR